MHVMQAIPLDSCLSRRNYYLLITFFALATVYSFVDLQRQQRLKKGQTPAGTATVDGLGYAVVTLFHINLTVNPDHHSSWNTTSKQLECAKTCPDCGRPCS